MLRWLFRMGLAYAVTRLSAEWEPTPRKAVDQKAPPLAELSEPDPTGVGHSAGRR